jgi:hypothetical protein
MTSYDAYHVYECIMIDYRYMLQAIRKIYYHEQVFVDQDRHALQLSLRLLSDLTRRHYTKHDASVRTKAPTDELLNSCNMVIARIWKYMNHVSAIIYACKPSFINQENCNPDRPYFYIETIQGSRFHVCIGLPCNPDDEDRHECRTIDELISILDEYKIPMWNNMNPTSFVDLETDDDDYE